MPKLIPASSEVLDEAEEDDEQDLRLAAGSCELCGRSWKQHPRCRACSIGLGEGHLEGPGVEVDGQAYCCDCAARTIKARAVRQVAA